MKVLNFEIIIEKKYILKAVCSGKNRFSFEMNETFKEAEYIEMSDGGLIIIVDGKSHVTYSKEESNGLFLIIDDNDCIFTKEFDPSKIRSSNSGKFVRYLVDDGSHLKEQQAFGEVEMMKMIITLYAPMSGKLKYNCINGSTLKQGDIIAYLDLDDPTSIKRAIKSEEKFEDDLFEKESKKSHLTLYKDSIKNIKTLLSGKKIIKIGYQYPISYFEKKLNFFLSNLRNILNNKVHFADFVEKFSILIIKLPKIIQEDIMIICDSNPEDFTVKEIIKLINDKLEEYMIVLDNNEKVNKFKEEISEIFDLFQIYEKDPKFILLNLFIEFANQYLSVEKLYQINKSQEDIYLSLRDENKENLEKAFEICFSHTNFKQKNKTIQYLLEEVEKLDLVKHFLVQLDEFSSLIGNLYKII
jgi:acetyl-CoA carboxylase/biotin carboxylase 1